MGLARQWKLCEMKMFASTLEIKPNCNGMLTEDGQILHNRIRSA